MVTMKEQIKSAINNGNSNGSRSNSSNIKMVNDKKNQGQNKSTFNYVTRDGANTILDVNTN